MIITTYTVITGVALRYFRFKTQMTNIAAAESIGVTLAQYRDFEAGQISFDADKINALLQLFNEDSDSLDTFMEDIRDMLAKHNIRVLNVSNEYWAQRMRELKNKPDGIWLKTLALNRLWFGVRCIRWGSGDATHKD